MSNSGNYEENLPAARSRIINPSLLLPAESVVFELKPSLWYAFLVSLPFVIGGVALCLVAYIAYTIPEVPSVVSYWGMTLGVWIIGLRVVVALLQWMGCTYVLTDRRALKQHGVINVRVECVGLDDVTNTFVAQAAFQRVVGIGNLFFRCKGAGGEAMIWEHVRRPKDVHAHVVAYIDRWRRLNKPHATGGDSP